MQGNHKGYRIQAEYCERKAETAPTPEISASWRRLAGEWLALIPEPNAFAPPREGQRQLA